MGYKLNKAHPNQMRLSGGREVKIAKSSATMQLLCGSCSSCRREQETTGWPVPFPGHTSAWPKSMQVIWLFHTFLISETIGSLFEPIGISRRPSWHHRTAPLPNVDAESTYATMLRLRGPDDLGCCVVWCQLSNSRFVVALHSWEPITGSLCFLVQRWCAKNDDLLSRINQPSGQQTTRFRRAYDTEFTTTHLGKTGKACHAVSKSPSIPKHVVDSHQEVLVHLATSNPTNSTLALWENRHGQIRQVSKLSTYNLDCQKLQDDMLIFHG